MKKLLLVLSAFICINAMAGTGDLFDLNIDEINSEFQELTLLEDAVVANPAMTFNNAVSQNLVGNNFMPINGLNSMQEDFVFQWEGFLWGFLCCPIGFFVVAVNKNKTKDNKLSFWIGWGAGVALNLIYNAATGFSAYSTTN